MVHKQVTISHCIQDSHQKQSKSESLKIKVQAQVSQAGGNNS